MLDTIPPEILAQISYHLSSPTLTPPVDLLCTSRHFNQHLSPSNNPNLYARLYKDNFDTSAAGRRLGRKVGNVELTKELAVRARALRKLGGGVGISQVQDRDIWVLYLLIIEHDEKNLNHLFSDTFNILDFLRRYSEENLLSSALESGYPTESAGRSLITWIAWLLFTYGIGREETSVEKAKRYFILRPYVFAAHKYSAYYGPWTNHNLPMSVSQQAQAQAQAGSSRNAGDGGGGGIHGDADHPFLADLKPKSRGVEIEHYGQKVMISPPLLAHAAILRFFKRHNPDNDFDDEDEDEHEDEDNSEDDEIEDGIEIHTEANEERPTSMSDQDPTTANETDPPTFPHQNSTLAKLARKQKYPDTQAPAPLSQMHDRDWSRLTRCYDASSSPGMKVRDWRNAFQGCWEGNFSFFEFEAFSEMVAGNSRALYEGPFGQQAQVWRITETFVWPKKDRTPSTALPESRTDTPSRSPSPSPSQNDTVIDKKEKGKGKEPAPPPPSPGLPLNGPATNAGYPTNLPAPSPAGLSTPSAEQITLAETIRHQVEAIEGYEVVPATELDQAIERGEEGLEVLLTGTGHSAWGRFILKGRVRVWDGMATLVKEYAPDARGKWIYRGYVIAGDMMVGRWRDTYTPEKYIGYEGTFTLSRRE